MGEAAEAQRKLLEALGDRCLSQSLRDPGVQQGLDQLATALEAVNRNGDGDSGIAQWSSQQLEQLLGILSAVVASSWDLASEEGQYSSLQRIFFLTAELCIQSLETPSFRSDEAMQQKLLQLLEAVTLDGKAERLPHFSSAGVPPDLMISLLVSVNKDDSHHGDRDVHINQDEGTGWSQNILAVLSNDQLVRDSLRSGSEIDKELLSRRGQNLVDVTQQHSIVSLGCFQRLSALCTGLVVDLDGDGLSFATEVLSFLGNLARLSRHRASVQGTVTEVVRLASALRDILKSSTRDKRVFEVDDVQEGATSLPLLMDALLVFCESFFPDLVISQNVRTFLAASILEEMNGVKLRQDTDCTPQLVSYVLRLLQADQFHVSEGRYGRKVPAEELVGSIEFRSQDFKLNQARSRSEHLETIFPSSGEWLNDLFAAAAILQIQGVKLKPVLEMPSSIHSEEDSATVSMDSLTVASEDDALFGDLFSESGRHSVNSEETVQTAPAPRKADGMHNALLQASSHLLCFIRDFILSSEWHKPTFEVVRAHLSTCHLDELLEIHRSHTGKQARVDDQELEGSLDLLAELQKCSFDVLITLVDRGVLSEGLQTHLFHQMAKEGDSPGGLSGNVLVLMAKVLINRFCQGVTSSNDPLVHDLWRSFVDSIVDNVKNIKAFEGDLDKATAVLPSWFHMEVLFMAFHSLDSPNRLAIVNLLSSALATCDNEKKAAGASLAPWALLTSRLVLAAKYLIFHFSSFPKWLVSDLSKQMWFQKSSKLPIQEGLFPSWAAIFARRPVHHMIDERCISHLFDVSCPAGGNLVISSDVEGLHSHLSSLLEAWTGRFITNVDELLLERYLFMLCWSILQGSSFATVHPWNSDTSTGLEFFFKVAKSVSAGFQQQSSDGVGQWAEFFLQSFKSLEVSMHGGSIKLTSWDLLRQGATLALLYLPLQRSPPDMLFHHVLRYIVENGQLEQLLQSLSSIVGWYVKAADYCLSQILLEQFGSEDIVSFIGLVLRTNFPKDRRYDMLDKAGGSSSVLRSLLRWESSRTWTDELSSVVKKAGAWEKDGALSPVVLHGFPLCSYQGDAALVSCMLTLEGLLQTIENVLDTDGVKLSSSQVDGLLKTIMPVKVNCAFDRLEIFCTNILFAVNLPEDHVQLYADVYTLKHVEWILKILCTSKHVPEPLREGIVCQVLEVTNTIRTDARRSRAFSVQFGASDSQEGVRTFVEQGNLSSYVDVLDGCSNETVNMQMLRFLVDLLEKPSSFQLRCRSNLQEKLLAMERDRLGTWLEQRISGCKIGDKEAVPSSPVRELAVRFVQNIIASEAKELKAHILEAMLTTLERAFTFYGAEMARSYLMAIVQLASGEPLLKDVSRAVVDVLSKVPADGDHLEGLQWLLAFLNSVLMACGARKVLFSRSKHPSSQGTSSGKAKVPRGSSDQSLQVTEGGNADCDATSADEDDDEGTSDGELTSLDREHDEDGINTERLLASRVCTFTSSGSNFMEQHWYFCYTCDLTVSKGCCSVCAKVCHRGHKVVYSRLSRFFCDCGAGGVKVTNCQCLKPRKYTVSPMPSAKLVSSTPEQQLFPIHERLQLSDSDSETESDDNRENQEFFQLSVSERDEKDILLLLSNLDLEGQLLELCRRLLSSFSHGFQAAGNDEIQLGQEKVLQLKNDIFQLKRAYKSGSLDMKIKVDYPNSRELRSHLLNGSLSKSLLTISSRGRLAAGEGDKVTLFDVGQLIGQPTATPVIVDKTTVKPLSKNSVRFEVVQLVFNPANESYLAVAGYEDCLVFTVSPRGEVTDRLALELALQDAYIRRVTWLVGSQVELMVVTNKFVKIYDLSQDKISPMHYFTVLEDEIVDATLGAVSHGQILVLVLSQQGALYTQRISKGSDSGARILTDVVQIPKQGRPVKGVSVHYSSSLKLLFASFSDGSTLLGRLNADATALSEVSSVIETDQDNKSKTACLHHWKEVFDGSGLFSCLSSQKSNSASVVHVRTNSLEGQHLRVAGSLRVDGISSYRSMAKERSHVLLLYDDGSMHVFQHVSSSAETTMKKLGAAILSTRSVSPAVFPLDFFEKTTCITSDIKIGGDVLRNDDAESVKRNLASDDGFLESPSASGFKILVFNSNVEMVMVGCRIHVGNTSASHIPSEVKLFQRVIRLEEGVRSWYDIPFTSSESLTADEEFALTVGPTFNSTSLPRIDSLEVYARSKEDFGWKEKLDAVLDLENQGQGAASQSNALKTRKLQTASTLDKVFYEVFKALSGLYSLHRLNPDSELNLENCKGKCMPVLEVVFASDRQSLLLSAGRHVLRALSLSKDAYYQAKDMMSLSGVARSCPLLASKLSLGGIRLSWMVQEFTNQVRTVCKISLHRPSNLALYLERNGSSLVENLVGVLWEILVLSDQLDAQTINDLVVLIVDLIYGYAECLSAHLSVSSVSPAVNLLEKLLFAPQDAVRSSSSLAVSSRLLQVPLPKQTMLLMDDGAENSRAGSLHSDSGTSTVASGQVMLEEDPGTASVQYCCDGCSTVPIQRRRWHCTVCPDFDLCEACFEVMDGDQLPPPHTRDHPMTAIAIEADTTGNSHEIPFNSIDDLSEESLLQMATELSLQSTAASLGSTMEATESCEFPENVPEVKAGSFSASKTLVNSLLLSGLLENLRGWTKSTTGTMAIPIMQLFYRLTTAPSSPLFDASGAVYFDKVVKVMLDELDVANPFSVKQRSGFGEVVILIFMLFTLLLRHWHQPGSIHGQPREGDGTTDAELQYDRVCASLRQQSLVNFLLNITQQLVHVFKSSSRGQDSSASSTNAPCGALLTVRREFAAGSFTPFFSDSYAKSHKGDLFVEFYKLMLESVFRLTYSLVRPGKSEKLSDKEQSSSKGCPGSELKLDGWQEVLCSYINSPHTTFIRKYARRLLLHMCGSKSHYYNVRDAWQLNREVKKLYKLVQKSGGFHVTVPYERSVKVLKCLSLIREVAAARPRNWQKYCSRHSDVIPFLLNGSFCFGEELVVQTLKLLALAFYSGKDLLSSKKDATETAAKGGSEGKKDKKGGSDDASLGADKGYLDMKQAVEQLVGEDGRNLKNFLDAFLLEWNAASIRSEAKTVLSGAWYHGEEAFRVLLVTLLLERIPMLPAYGQNVQEFTELLSWLLKKGTQEIALSNPESVLVQGCLTGNTIMKIFETLRLQNELLANHPNSRIYSTLVSLVEFDGYYLESEPCLACNSPEIPYNRMKLETIKAETKYTDNSILVKCIGSHTIQSVTMNVHEPRRSKSIKVLNLYYNNRVVADLSELKNNRSLWKRARSCQLNFGQTELKVEFPIPITACNFMIELDCFYENLQAASVESLQCPRCSRVVTDKHGICSNCHENAYQCRQCRNINYENLDSFLCNECGYSKYGRFEFNFMAKPSYTFDRMENDEDMKKGLAAIEAESENAHKRYQQLLGYKKPLLKLVSSIGESDADSQQKDTVQQMVALPSSFKINRKIAILGVLYGEKCKMAFDSVSKSVQTLQGLRRVLMSYLERKRSPGSFHLANIIMAQRHPNRCFGCANTFVGHCLEWLQILARIPYCRQQLVAAGILSELFENNIHQGPKSARIQARTVLSAFTEGDLNAVGELNSLIKQKVIYCLEHHRSMDIAACVRDEMQLLSETCSLGDDFWEARLRVAFQLLFRSIQVGARHPVIAEHIILPALRIISQACTPPKTDIPQATEPGGFSVKSVGSFVKTAAILQETPVTRPAKENVEKDKELENTPKAQDLLLVNYLEWKNGATYVDFVRRLTISQNVKPAQKSRKDSRKSDALALKYILRWKRKACKVSLTEDLKCFEDSSWVRELVLSACSQPIRQEMCALIEVLCSQSVARKSKFLDLFMNLLPASRTAGESAAEYFDLLFKMIEDEDARLYLTVRGFLRTACSLISEEVVRVEAQERSFHTDISQGYTLHKLIELLNKFLQVPNVRIRFMKEDLLSQILEALLVIRGLVVQKTKLISDCGRLLRELLDNLLQESDDNKRHFVRACISGLQTPDHDRKDRRCLFILEQLCNIICPAKPEPAYMLVLNKAHTQEEFIRGSMTKNPYSSLEVGPLMRDVKNKICQQLDMIALLEDDYGMELLVAGSIISLDLSVAQVYEQVWRKAHSQVANSAIGTSLLMSASGVSGRECPPMTVTYRLQGLDGEATEPMIKELDDDREESQDPEIEFAITGVMKDSGGLKELLSMVEHFTDEELKSGQEQVALVLKLLMFCCKIRGNRQALLQLGALDVLLETANKSFSSAESVERLLLIVECLVTEANESDVGVTEGALSTTRAGIARGEQAAKGVLMFLERLSNPSSYKQSKQHKNSDTAARILPYLTYGEEAAMEVLVDHFLPYLLDWGAFDKLQKEHGENPKDASLGQKAAFHQFAVENFVKVTESIKQNDSGELLKNLILEKKILTVAIRYLKDAFPFTEKKTDLRSSPEWTRSLELPSVPIILSMMRGLSIGHCKTQECLDEEEVLPLLHALEGMPGENEIGARAENLLDTLSDKETCGEGFLAETILNLRETTRDEMRRRALQRREELLQGLGMRRELRSDGGERIVISKPRIEGLEDVEEEEAGLACMVCREGYKLRPTDMLGAYSYSKRVNIGSATVHGRPEWVYTTVSHFNVIHVQCHQEAKRADASLKNPKKEWEGAAIRNNETLCNDLFPLRGPAVALAQYSRCVDTFWDNLNALGRADGSRLRLLTYDIVLMLGRFATGASFSVDSKGGGKESNSRLLPFMVQMARHLLDQQGPSQRRVLAKSLQTFLQASPPETDATTTPLSRTISSPGTPARSDETVQYMMVQSLLLQSHDEWQQHRKTFLQRGAVHAYMLHKQGRVLLQPASPLPASTSPSPAARNPIEFALSFSPAADIKRTASSGGLQATSTPSLSSEQLFSILQPMLVFIGIIDQLQRFFKSRSGSVVANRSSSGSSSSSSAGGTTDDGTEAWEATMKEKLRDVSAMLAFSKDLLEWLEDMQSSADLQEALDVMGALGDAFSAGFSSCDEFFRDALGLASL
ncbi:auxin transport protein BIG [Selaginella moellendorffii]|uniref:auxin transport protein BIG n=1 Tax=Selaginella moellendorffii TaxID=88036 RepID=UPI000D1C7EA5|nr:auxin transport protein BIG [Selaginella moellendorffii]|eukprot:XP_024544363.1 auxin transport protein BIG [Selaginella moellendorffii]